jgi:hypothetical protein
MKKLIILALLFGSYKGMAQNNVLTSAQMRELFVMDSSQYTSFATQVKSYRDSIIFITSDTTINKSIRMNKIGLIYQHQEAYLEQALTPAQRGIYNNFIQTRAAVSPRLRNQQ